MKLTSKTILNATRKRKAEETDFAVLDNLGINSAGILQSYHNLLFLSLKYNQLQSVEFLRGCSNLWILELQQNPVSYTCLYRR